MNQSYLLQLRGDFTSRKANEVKQQLSDLIDQGYHELLLDCTSIDDVDIVGINVLALTGKKIRSRNGSMKITLNRNSQLEKMLHITKFNLLLTYTYQ